MRTAIVNANSEIEAIEICENERGFAVAEAREVDSGEEGQRAWMCFESVTDAETWDKQI